MDSVYDLGVKARKNNKTENNKYWQFPVNTRVVVISPCVDFTFFYNEKGVVIKSTNEYFGIRVKFDKPRYYADGTILYDFNFNPEDLKVIEKFSPKTGCPKCDEAGEMCIDCQIEQADANVLKAMNRLEELKAKKAEMEKKNESNS
jgi:hypothetical protein